MDLLPSTPGPAQETADQTISEVDNENPQQAQAIQDSDDPLNLLDLPLEILQLIVKEVTPKRNLIALAQANTLLHNLAIPCIYSSLDTAWPATHCRTRAAALLHCLTTFGVESAFARTLAPKTKPPTNRVDHNYAKYTKSFSLLGAGPSSSDPGTGKVLGGLVAGAVSRMPNLESFISDVRSGMPPRAFEALASLAQYPDNECKLRDLWVRLQDNSARRAKSGTREPPIPSGCKLTPIGLVLPEEYRRRSQQSPVSYAEYGCPYPTFSILPPLKSLAVLDIDEVGYLDEMAVLIERSKDMLQDLRLGMSPETSHRHFSKAWDAPELCQIDHLARWPGESTIGDYRLGGVLGVLVAKIFDIRRPRPSNNSDATAAGADVVPTATAEPATVQAQETHPTPSSHGEVSQQVDNTATASQDGVPVDTEGQSTAPKAGKSNTEVREKLSGNLKLRTLELERVALSLQVMRFAFDWTVLTNLTLLDCPHADALWRVLRKEFAPVSNKKLFPNAPLHYQLSLKSIRTTVPTLALIAFIKDALAPNTLQELFLQGRGLVSHAVFSTLTLDEIFRGAIKPQHASLRVLHLDSSLGAKDTRWRRWALSTDVLLYMTSGRMRSLRELAMSMCYKDWHTLLTRLPNLPNLVTLNIPNLADHPSTPTPNPFIAPSPSAPPVANLIPNSIPIANPIPPTTANLPPPNPNIIPAPNPMPPSTAHSFQTLTTSILALANALVAPQTNTPNPNPNTNTANPAAVAALNAAFAAAAPAGTAGAPPATHRARDTSAFDNTVDLAFQVKDVLALRPEMKLAFVGIAGRAFEVLECTRLKEREKGKKGKGKVVFGGNGGGNGGAANVAPPPGGVAVGVATPPVALAATPAAGGAVPTASTAAPAGSTTTQPTTGNGGSAPAPPPPPAPMPTTSLSTSWAGTAGANPDDIDIELVFSSDEEDDDDDDEEEEGDSESDDDDDGSGNTSAPANTTPPTGAGGSAGAQGQAVAAAAAAGEAGGTGKQGEEEEEESEYEDDGFVEPGSGVTLKVREMLYFDDKAAVFAVRNGLKLGTF